MDIDSHTIFWLVIIIGIPSVMAVAAKWYWQYKLDHDKVEHRKQKEAANPENEVDNFLTNIPKILADRERMYEEVVKEHGVNDKTAKSLKGQIDMLRMAQQYEPIINTVGKPLIKKIIKLINGFSL